jgi:hypothetical protein
MGYVILVFSVLVIIGLISKSKEKKTETDGVKLGTHIKLDNGKIVNKYLLTPEDAKHTKEYKFLEKHNKLHYITNSFIRSVVGYYDQLVEAYNKLREEIASEDRRKQQEEAQRRTEAEWRRELQAQTRRKQNWHEYKRIIDNNNARPLYHFTDRSNLQSIQRHGALYSWHYCSINNITIPAPGGTELSRDLDRRHGVHNFVRVSFTRDHPMMHVALKEGRIHNPVILEIDEEVIYWNYSKYANKNATRNDVCIGENVEDFSRIRFDLVRQNYFNLSDTDKPYYQAEVLVLEKIPAEFIRNIHTA